MLKKIIVFALVLTLSVGMLSSLTLFTSAEATTTNTYDGGTGKATDPYIISTEASLKALADAVNGGANQSGVYFELGNDITLTSNWTPIGQFDDSDAEAKIDFPFCGNFNGKGYEIKDLNIETTDVQSIGLFGNLGINENGIGATVKNVTVSGNITATARFVGGIAGITMTANIYNCVSNVTINVQGYTKLPRVGGIVGFARTVTNVEYCVNNGDITVEPIKDAPEGVTVPADLIVAGIAGELSEMCNVRYCISEADIEIKNVATAYIGGIVGRATGAALTGMSGLVTDCAVKGNLTASEGVTTGCIGGAVSYLHSAGYTIKNCGVVGTITTPPAAEGEGMKLTYLGYLVGNSKNPATIEDCKVSGEVLLGKNAGVNEPANCTTGVTEIDSLEFAIEDAIKAWAKADAEAVVTEPPTDADTTTEAPDDETTAPDDGDTTTPAAKDTTTTRPDTTTKAPDNTTAKPADKDEGGCGGIGIAQTIAIFVALFGGAAAFVKVKKNG